MVETAKQGGALRATTVRPGTGAMPHTTAADRVQIVQDCLANGCDYGATALKYNVDYKALVNWVGRYRAHGPAALHDSRHSSEERAAPRAVRAVRRCSALSLCWTVWKNGKNYGAMAQKYAVAYHQVYRWVQRYLRDGWLGMNDRRGPSNDPGGVGARGPPPMRTPQKNGWPVRGRAETPAARCAAPGTAGA